MYPLCTKCQHNLVTGGARGITAETAKELAERFRPTLLLVGRTPLPGNESQDTAGLDGPQELKAAIIDTMRRQGQTPLPVQIEAAYNRLLNEREIAANIEADVTDEVAFGAVIDSIYDTYGRLDGVIHGAGIIEDKLIKDKSTDSFERVLDTKCLSAFVLSRKLKAESLRFLALFSSVSARYGNRGQSDYAAANEVLNKLAAHLDQKWPDTRVVSINWGPWRTAGMVSDAVEQQFKERGITIIPIDAGRRMLVHELTHSAPRHPEVVVQGNWDDTVTVNDDEPPELPSLPLLESGTSLMKFSEGAMEISYTLDPDRDIYLRDHRLNGQLVFPMAIAMELMAEAALTSWPELQVLGFTDIRMLRGIVIENKPRSIRVTTLDLSDDFAEIRQLEVTIESAQNPAQVHYKAIVELGMRLPQSPLVEIADVDDAAIQPPMSIEYGYKEMLFHGPLLRGIKHIEATGRNGLTTLLIPSSPRNCLAGGAVDIWLIDPVVIDCAFQSQIIWGRMQWDMASLPSRIGAFRQYAPLAGHQIRCETRIHRDTSAPLIRADHYFYNVNGKLLAMLEDVEHIASKALNQFNGGRFAETEKNMTVGHVAAN